MAPKVSIVMPVYNGEKYIRDALDSILKQSFTDWEFLIINEYGSNEAVTGILREYEQRDQRIRVIQNKERLWIAESLNVGLRAAKGVYIARMDADDIAGKDRLKNQVAYMDAHPEIDICGLKVDMFGENTWDWKVYTDPAFLKCACLFYTPFVHPTIIMRKESLQRNDLEYNSAFHYTEDFDFFTRASHSLKFTNLIEKGLYSYRYLSTNATNVGGDQGLRLQNQVMDQNLQKFGLCFNQEEIKLLSPNTYPKATYTEQALDDLEHLDLLMKQLFFCDGLREEYGTDTLFQVLHRRWMDVYEGYRWQPEIMRDGQVQRAMERGLFYRNDFYKAEVKKSSAPRISVILPTYNSEDYIMDTLYSLLEQDYDDFELLIVNEYGSNDRTVKCIQMFADPRIRVIQNQKKLGLAESLNEGVRQAVGEYIARADADDVYPRDRFTKQVHFLETHPEIAVCGSWQRHFGKRNYIHKPPVTKEELKVSLLFNCEVCHSTVMFRREALLALGTLYDSAYLSEDYELWSRASNTLNFATIPEILGEYRWNGENITAKKMDMLDIEAQKIVRRNLYQCLGMNISDEDLILLSGWKNPFMEEGPLQPSLRKREEVLLEEIECLNNQKKALDPKALSDVLNRRRVWAGLQQKGNVVPQETMVQEAYRGGVAKRFCKKIFKRFYRPFRQRYENRLIDIQKNLWDQMGIVKETRQRSQDMDGHLYDYYADLKNQMEEQNEMILQLQQSLLQLNQQNILLVQQIKQLDSFARFGYESVNAERTRLEKIIAEIAEAKAAEIEKTIIEAMDHRIYQSESIINEATDVRIGKAEQLINETTDARVGKAEQLINETTDARIWKAEQLINETTDVRIWKAEQLINETTDARIWKAEQLINETTDARIWKAEQLINETTDARIWKAEKKESEIIKSGFWNIQYEFQKFTKKNNISNIVYDDIFYQDNRYHSMMSARSVLGYLLKKINVESIIDFGCGSGTWLGVAMNYGVGTVLGLDGDYVPRNMLMIPEKNFKPVDLSEEYKTEHKYDLAISMEVAEHLPESSATVFVQSLCNASDMILFSAAHPGQGGDGHINEQPPEYWIEKFSDFGYKPIEIRQYFQEDENVAQWYKDNMRIFVSESHYAAVRQRIEDCKI